MAPRLTKAEVSEIIRLKKQGKSNQVVAGLVGRSRDTVKRYAVKGCYCRGTLNTHTTKCPKWRAN